METPREGGVVGTPNRLHRAARESALCKTRARRLWCRGLFSKHRKEAILPHIPCVTCVSLRGREPHLAALPGRAVRHIW